MDSGKHVNTEETKRLKAKNLRYKKPIAKGLNLCAMKEALWDMQEACDEVQYYMDGDDDTLINALDGDEDDAVEFKMMFAGLSAECEQMQYDLENEYVPEYLDIFFAAANKGGEMLGYDTYECDYYGLDSFESNWAGDEAAKKLKRLTKDELIEATRRCFRVYQSYIGLQYRYDCIKSALDILRDRNTGHLQMVEQIESLYEKVDEETNGFKWTHIGGALSDFNRLLENMPQEAWIQ